MATIDLGKIKLVWRGTYDGATSYTVDDVVQHTDSGLTSSFICTTASTGNAPSTSGTVHGSWAYLAKGAAAFTSPLTTQGDVFFRDGSGDQRLAAGTSGQVLTTGGSGANPTWGTVSSDFVLLSTITASDTASVSFDGFYSATYRDYYITISNMVPATDNQDLYFMIRESDADYSSSNYRGWLSGTEKYSSGQNHGTQGNTWYNSSHAKLTGHSGGITNNASYGGMSGNVNIFDPLGTTGYKWQQGAHSFYNNNGTNVIGGRMTNVTQTTAASSGFSIYMSSGNIASGVFKMYGLK